MMMNAPPHVGEILRELYLEPLEMSVTEAANHLGVTRQALSRLLNEKSGISFEMAFRLAKAFRTSPEYWVNLDSQHALWEASIKYENLGVIPFDKAA